MFYFSNLSGLNLTDDEQLDVSMEAKVNEERRGCAKIPVALPDLEATD